MKKTLLGPLFTQHKATNSKIFSVEATIATQASISTSDCLVAMNSMASGRVRRICIGLAINPSHIYPTAALSMNFVITRKGLTADEAARRLRTSGTNELTSLRPEPWYSILISCLVQPFNVVLAVLAILIGSPLPQSDFVTMSIMIVSAPLMFPAIRSWRDCRDLLRSACIMILISALLVRACGLHLYVLTSNWHDYRRLRPA